MPSLTGSATSHGYTAAAVYGLATAGPSYPTWVQPSGATAIVVAGALDGTVYDTAVSVGAASVAVNASGSLAAAAEADGFTSITVGIATNIVASAQADGRTFVALIYSPDLFGDPGADPDLGPDPEVPTPSSPPVQIAVELRGACSVMPPVLDLV